MMHAFLALGLDGRTVRNLYYYQQRKRRFWGLGWKTPTGANSGGKRLLDNSGHPALKMSTG